MAGFIKPDGITILVTIIAFAILDTLAVVLRLLSKSKTTYRFGSDDYWMLAALLIFYARAGINIYSVVALSGTLDVPLIPDISQMQELTKALWIATPIFPLTITPVKISILCFYRRVFPPYWVAISTYVLTSLCVLWLLSGFWVTIFQCTPWRAVFDFSLQPTAHCISFGTFVFVYELLNGCLDVAILAIPAIIVPKLCLGTRRKIQVLMVFFTGAFVLITCVLRMMYSYNPNNPKAVPSYTKAMLWSSIELGVAIICGNLPTYGPLVRNDHDCCAAVATWCSGVRNPLRKQSSIPSGTDSNHMDFRSHRDDAGDLARVSEEDDNRPRSSLSMETIPVEDRAHVSPNLKSVIRNKGNTA